LPSRAVPREPPLLPGEIDQRTGAERLRNRIPLDRETMRSRRIASLCPCPRRRLHGMTPSIRPNPVREAPRSGGTAWGGMAFEFFTPGLPFALAAAFAEGRADRAEGARCRATGANGQGPRAGPSGTRSLDLH
jgi:hypothetical protein